MQEVIGVDIPEEGGGGKREWYMVEPSGVFGIIPKRER
jgi:hypothetical protein